MTSFPFVKPVHFLGNFQETDERGVCSEGTARSEDTGIVAAPKRYQVQRCVLNIFKGAHSDGTHQRRFPRLANVEQAKVSCTCNYFGRVSVDTTIQRKRSGGYDEEYFAWIIIYSQ